MKPGNKKGVLASSALIFSLLLASAGLAESPKPPSPSPVGESTAKPVPTPAPTQKVTASSSPTASPTKTASASLSPSVDTWMAVGGGLVAAIIGAIMQSLFAPLVQHQLEHRRKRQEQEAAAREAAEREKAAVAQWEQTVKDGSQAYRQKLLAELSNMKILDMSSPLRLEDIYVQLRVREEEPLRYAKEEEMAPLASGEPKELLRRSQAHLAERAEIAMSPEDALVNFRRIAVLGDPGAGKTTMLRYLALKMDQNADPELPYLPVYVELGRFVESGMHDLLEFLAADWHRRYGFPNALPFVEQQLHEGKAALLLDGLDEVLVGATPDEAQKAYKLVADEINRLDTRFSGAPIAVTCRKAGWRGGLKGFQTLEVLDFSWEQIQQFVNNWFKSNPAKAKGLRQALCLNLRMQTLAANPLILSLIAIVYEEQLELPERRAELYNRCSEVLLREWDAHRGIKRFSQFTADRKRDLLKEVAWHFHIEGRRYFPEAELQHIVANFLPTIDIPPSESKVILSEIAAQYGLLKVQAHGWYGFLHLTFQEYLAALAANERGAAGIQQVVAHRSDPWWEEVILLLAGRMNDATPLLLGLLGHAPDQPLPAGELAAKDDLFHSDLLLAARCLEGTPIIRMRGLRDRLLFEVKNLLACSPYKLDWERASAVLVEIGGTAMINELLAMLPDESIERWKRCKIALAFEELGDQGAAVGLLEILQREAQLDPLVRGYIVLALAELKPTFAVPYMLDILKADKDDYAIQEKIANVLGSLGDKSAVPELMEMLIDQQRNDCVRSYIALCLGSLGDESVAPVLLAMLLDKTTPPRIKPSIAQALRDFGDIGARELMERLEDETIDWQIRWLLTEALEGCSHAVAPLRKLLERSNIHKGVRVGIAATLESLGVRTHIPEILREAIENQIVPPNWSLGDHVETGYVWQRITRTLNSLGDDSVVPALVRAFEQRASWSKEFDEVKGIIVAACEYQPEAIAKQVLGMLREQQWRSYQDDLLELLPQLATKSLVPELLVLLAERRMYNLSDNRWIIQAIAQVADDRETVKALLEIMPAKPSSDEEKYMMVQVIYAGLYSVSRRAGVRVSPEGQIESLMATVS